MFLLKKIFCFLACFMMIKWTFLHTFNKINWNCMCRKGRYMQYNILFCILTVGKHGTDARIQEFSSGGGGEGPGQSDKKAPTTIFLVLSLFYRSQMVNFKEIYRFSRLQMGYNFFLGSNFFPGGGGGGCPIAYSL